MGDKVNQEEAITPPASQGNFVSEELAIYTANHFANSYGFNYNNLLQNKTVKKKGGKKVVEHVLEVQDQNKRNAIYLINYQEGGFVIVSGDKRANPILAYSETNQLPTQTNEDVPGGLSVWIKKNVRDISVLGESKQKINQHAGWQAILNSNKTDSEKSKLPPEDTCEPWSIEVDPLLETTWSQANGYNNFAPNYNCSYPTNGRAYAGCVATAIGQVMRYHEYPQTYNWSAMPNNIGSNETSQLLYDIGENVDMNWGCDVSGADDDDMDNTLHHFGYTSAHQIGYEGTNNYEDVKDELDAGRPVIFSGCEKDHVFLGIFPVGRPCHAWVGDGYRSFKACPSGNGYLFFHMNWGWRNGSYNGFFGYNDFTPGEDGSYNYKSEVVVGINP